MRKRNGGDPRSDMQELGLGVQEDEASGDFVSPLHGAGSASDPDVLATLASAGTRIPGLGRRKSRESE